MKIAMVSSPWRPTPPDGYGPIPLLAWLLAEHLQAQGHQVIVFGREGSDPRCRALAEAAWAEDIRGPDEIWREATYLTSVQKHLRAESPDLVHDHNGVLGSLTAAASGRPTVITAHGSIRPAQEHFFSSLPSHVGVVAVSREQRRSFATIPWVETVPNAIDVDSLQLEPWPRSDHLVQLARITPAKGLHLAIRVARRLGRRLVVAGPVGWRPSDRSYHEEVLLPAAREGVVEYLPEVAGEDKCRLLATAHAYLSPVCDEPFGIAMAEALACGTPVVAFRSVGAMEVLDQESTGWIVEGEDDMVAAVERCEPLDAIVVEAARRRFHPRVMAERYSSVYSTLLDSVVT